MRGGASGSAVALFAAVSLAACSPRAPATPAAPSDALDTAIGSAIGDPTTCVLLADPASGKVIYRYGQMFNCQRPLPACDRGGMLTAQAALRLAAAGRDASCASNAEGTRRVGWAEGRTQVKGRHLTYSMVMEGERALPGHEMAARFAEALDKGGL